MRRFVRHSASIPVDVISDFPSEAGLDNCAMKTVSQGGLSCDLPYRMDIGTVVNIEIPSVSPPYKGTGEIVWCKHKDEHFEVGLRFTDKDEAFKARMVQQVCQIEEYRNMIFAREGRLLNIDQAALEWDRKICGYISIDLNV